MTRHLTAKTHQAVTVVTSPRTLSLALYISHVAQTIGA